MHRDYMISLGSNVGQREDYLVQAVKHIAHMPKACVRAISSVYETEPMELLDQPQFLNAVVHVASPEDPYAMLRSLLEIEQAMGRIRTVRYGPRVIDLDILLCGKTVIADLPELMIPHEHMLKRAFVLVPLAELAPEMVHPLTGKTIRALCSAVASREGVRRFGSLGSWG
ncbi:2-amino-4-hydroxy-6-hydroxymethyldihydropteridine diphosphokinase [Ferroacidibacillus organovorans]|uniref:2-amino-4-hydroxy-6-hydroxymethyldihydropteridine diphosphokinase n=1 Tax=Ferroacidibacillus organovorans TaxID=1765683 RepID=A0A117SY56_9BACL|nr:2-amino-4-hydroxy-6-hydroxymethyldihydropteridine diphosphokinase [Ferroacidibacillus organovorans]KUO96421.1 hypothetical protein ATW55_00815 [Ferroacidibacillus organovorans]